MISRVTLIFAIAIAVSAVPSSEHVPASEMIEASEHAEAQAQVNALLAAGKSDAACKSLAKSSVKAVEDSVKFQQENLNKLPTGESCKNKGQEAVKKAEKTKTAADKALKEAKKKVKQALKTDIKVETTYGEAKDKKCVVAKTNPKYKAAKQKYHSATQAEARKSGEAKQAKKSLDDAKAAAKKEMNECLCKTKKKHAEAWKVATKDNAAHQEAYQKAKNMLCVLGGKAFSKCKKHQAPKVKQPSMRSDVKNASCQKPKKPVGNLCTCKHGAPAVGAQCPRDGVMKCVACNQGYFLENNIVCVPRRR
jgi:hypothetical protein